jgi:Flp pilus assembly protein TadD
MMSAIWETDVPTSQELLAAGLAALARNQLDAALLAFEEVLAQDPKSDEAWMGIATVHERNDQLDAAVEAIQRAIELRPAEPLHHACLSRLYQRKGMKREAEEAMARSLRLGGGR